MNTPLTRADDMRTYDILIKLLEGEKLCDADKKYIAQLRVKMESALTTLNKKNIVLYTGIIGRYIVIEHYISLFSGMLFEEGETK